MCLIHRISKRDTGIFLFFMYTSSSETVWTGGSALQKERNKLAKAGDVIYVIVIMGLLLPFILGGAIFLWLAGLLFVLPLLAVLYVSLGVVMVIRGFNRRKYEKVIYRVLAGAIVLSVVYMIPGIYDKTRPVVRDGYVDLFEYAPFTETSKAVTLDGKATLKIDDKLPVIDGATAHKRFIRRGNITRIRVK